MSLRPFQLPRCPAPAWARAVFTGAPVAAASFPESWHGVPFGPEDWRSLARGQLVTDCAITALLRHFRRALFRQDVAWLTPHQAWQLLRVHGLTPELRDPAHWRARINHPAPQWLLCPVHDPVLRHWTLLLYNYAQCAWHIYDGLLGSNAEEQAARVHFALWGVADRDRVRARHPRQVRRVDLALHQTDGHSCGAFVLAHIAALATGMALPTTQEEVDGVRLWCLSQAAAGCPGSNS